MVWKTKVLLKFTSVKILQTKSFNRERRTQFKIFIEGSGGMKPGKQDATEKGEVGLEILILLTRKNT